MAEPDWLDQYLENPDGFPRPDWRSITRLVDERFPESARNAIWVEIATAWLNRIADNLPAGYSIHQSENFLLLTSESERYVSLLKGFLEKTRKNILGKLSGITNDDGYGKHLVIIIDDIDTYYAYMSWHFPDDGVYGMSSGIYLNSGYGHFVFPHMDLGHAESVAAHEMTHALVSHLPLPAWLNEGLAVNMENILTGSAPLHMNAEIHARHLAFWGEDEIQQFWSGEAFFRPDEGQELSYHLAQIFVNSLAAGYDAFTEFSNAARHHDSGESASMAVYGQSLSVLVSQLLGEGDWSPRPDCWQSGT